MARRFLFLAAIVMFSAWPWTSSNAEPSLLEVDAKALFKKIESSPASLTIVNVWATWCEPCKEEFPDLLSVARDFASRKVDLVFVTTDFEEDRAAAIDFLKSQSVKLPSYALGGKESAFIEALHPDWTGTMPATFIFSKKGQRLRFFQGKIHREQLEKALVELLEGSKGKEKK